MWPTSRAKCLAVPQQQQQQQPKQSSFLEQPDDRAKQRIFISFFKVHSIEHECSFSFVLYLYDVRSHIEDRRRATSI